jgi:hypothetical protein
MEDGGKWIKVEVEMAARRCFEIKVKKYEKFPIIA